VRLLLLSTGTGAPALPACGGASWCFVLWQQRWLVVAAGCCCELLNNQKISPLQDVRNYDMELFWQMQELYWERMRL
jgi:hypothetical protein